MIVLKKKGGGENCFFPALYCIFLLCNLRSNIRDTSVCLCGIIILEQLPIVPDGTVCAPVRLHPEPNSEPARFEGFRRGLLQAAPAFPLLSVHLIGA